MPKAQAYGIDIGDFANTQPLTWDQLQGLKNMGVNFVYQEYTFPGHFIPNISAIASAGILTSSYNFIYWSKTDGQILDSIQTQINRIESLREAGVEMGWWRLDGTFMPQLFIDFEADTLVRPARYPTPSRGIQLMSRAVEMAQAADIAIGVYTAEWFWKIFMGNYTGFSYLPLWHASQYTYTVPVPFSKYYTGHEYGGWPIPMVWQFRGTGNVAGVSCDQDLEEWESPS